MTNEKALGWFKGRKEAFALDDKCQQAEDVAITAIEALIAHEITVDAVQVVRCKDCRWYRTGVDINGKPFTRCNGDVRVYGHTKPEWFCADGKRRERE